MAVSVSRLTQESKLVTFWKGCVFESQFFFVCFFFVLFFCFLSFHFAFTFSFFVLCL